jgi:deazaflavin-dependent oxidoreductase (nitroreductase family)
MNLFAKMFVASHIGVFRATGGRVGSSMFGGRVLLLTTTGNKSGKPRTVPVMYFELDGQRYVIASFGGNPAHPAWYKNLAARPDVTVEIKGRRYPARAQVVEGEERARVWQLAVSQMKQFAGYEQKTDGKRQIPVVRLQENG